GRDGHLGLSLGCRAIVLFVKDVRLRILCTFCARVILSYTYLRRHHTVGNECPPTQWFLHIKNKSQSVIRTGGRGVGTASLTAAKPKFRVPDSSTGRRTGERKPSYTPVSPNLAYSVPRVCSSLGTLF
ncbi:hypothetical protein NPIL_134581, partial [Nephila pilipes]